MMTTDTNNTFSAAQNTVAPRITASRACRICRTDLTDAASMNEGIGPICRKKANLALAREIRTNIGRVDILGFLGLSFVLPTEAQATWAEVETVILGLSEDRAGLDLRKTVKQVAWVLSFELPRTTVEVLFSLVEALGYTAFANLLRLEGRPGAGEASVTFADGIVSLKAPRSRDGREALREIKGVFFKGAPLNTWNVTARAAEAFIKAVRRHWPLVTGATEALAQAEAFVAAAAPAAPVITKAALEIKVTLKNGEFLVNSPYNAGFVNELKTLPREARAWTGTAWAVRASYRSELTALLAKHYTDATVTGM